MRMVDLHRGARLLAAEEIRKTTLANLQKELTTNLVEENDVGS